MDAKTSSTPSLPISGGTAALRRVVHGAVGAASVLGAARLPTGKR